LIRLSLFSLLISCNGDGLSQEWQLDRMRILAVRATVDGATDPILGTLAEARPGDTLTFTSLTYAPDDDPIGGLLWMACLPEGPSASGCDLDPVLPTPDDDAPEDDSIIGFEPMFPPKWDIPLTALDGLPDSERAEGIAGLVNIIALPLAITESLPSPGQEPNPDAEEELDPADLAVAFKRTPISEAETPNHNPDIVDFVVSGTQIDGATGFSAQRGHIYIIEPLLADGHIETYAYTQNDGTKVFRSEEPYFSWYTEKGGAEEDGDAFFDQAFSLHPHTSVEWTAPKSPGLLTLHVVVRDRRGGMGWATLTVNVL
jgi:hypothetical protein